MRTWVVINPAAGGADKADLVHAWVADRADTVGHTSPDRATCQQIVAEGVRAGVERMVAAGGDGTVNAVVNALQAQNASIPLGIVPLGTGNDLARTLAIPREVDEALAGLDAPRTARIDLFELTAADAMRYGVNAAAGGFSGQVDEALTARMKATWGPLAFLLGAAQVLPDRRHYNTHVSIDDQPAEPVDAFNIVVANGQTAAGGRRVAPTARPDDGLLDVVIVRHGTVAELAEVGTRLVAGNYLESDLVTHRRVRRVRVRSDPGMWFNVDGDLVTHQPVEIAVRPGAQPIVVGPSFEALQGA